MACCCGEGVKFDLGGLSAYLAFGTSCSYTGQVAGYAFKTLIKYLKFKGAKLDLNQPKSITTIRVKKKRPMAPTTASEVSEQVLDLA